jgi:hypothetical protein
MYYMEQMLYAGEPPKVVLPGGVYLNTPVAEDVPVTHLMMATLLGQFRLIVRETQHQDAFRGKCALKFVPNGLQTEKIIGEQVIIFDSLWAMFCNSSDAGATKFVMEVTADDKNMTLLISDDGDGLHPEIEVFIFKRTGTSKGNGYGVGLFLALHCLKKIGATLTYEGKANLPGAEKPGAKFKITFLKEMPTT